MKSIQLEDDLVDYLNQHFALTGEKPSAYIHRLMKAAVKAAESAESKEGSNSTVNDSAFRPSESESSTATSPANQSADTVLGKTHALRPSGHRIKRRRKRLSGMTALDAFLDILTELHDSDPDRFNQRIPRVAGRKRVYFARTAEEIERSGNSTLPVPIPNTGWWVITNTATDRKKIILQDVFRELGLSAARKRELMERFEKGSVPNDGLNYDQYIEGLLEEESEDENDLRI